MRIFRHLCWINIGCLFLLVALLGCDSSSKNPAAERKLSEHQKAVIDTFQTQVQTADQSITLVDQRFSALQKSFQAHYQEYQALGFDNHNAYADYFDQWVDLTEPSLKQFHDMLDRVSRALKLCPRQKKPQIAQCKDALEAIATIVTPYATLTQQLFQTFENSWQEVQEFYTKQQNVTAADSDSFTEKLLQQPSFMHMEIQLEDYEKRIHEVEAQLQKLDEVLNFVETH